jgi:hypothetical protein
VGVGVQRGKSRKLTAPRYLGAAPLSRRELRGGELTGARVSCRRLELDVEEL